MASRAAKTLYVFQWAVLLLLCLPLLVLVVILSLPVATVLWVSGAVERGRKLAAERDPVLAMALKTDSSKDRTPIVARLAASQRVYTSLVAFGLHLTLRLFVRMARPKVAFVVYTSDYSILRRFFCVGTAELGYRAGIHSKSIHPETLWVYLMGIIHVDSTVGFGVYGTVVPALSQLTEQHLQQLPAAVHQAFPQAESIALAGRLPSLMTAAGVAIKAPIADGLPGTVYAMEATIDALISNLPTERRSQPTVAILGGAGYIATRLVGVLATRNSEIAQHRTKSSVLGPCDILPERDVDRPAGISTKMVARKLTTPYHIIALDLRYAGKRHINAGVLYTADPSDLEAADVVMVLTRTGDDVDGYVKHSRTGQEWADDTYPDIGHAVLQQLAARGINVHKAMATRTTTVYLLPPLPGYPAASTPGCLLMALVSAATHKDWNGCCQWPGGLARSGDDDYWAFAAAAKELGYHAMLSKHRRSKVDQDAKRST